MICVHGKLLDSRNPQVICDHALCYCIARKHNSINKRKERNKNVHIMDVVYTPK